MAHSWHVDLWIDGWLGSPGARGARCRQAEMGFSGHVCRSARADMRTLHRWGEGCERVRLVLRVMPLFATTLECHIHSACALV